MRLSTRSLEVKRILHESNAWNQKKQKGTILILQKYYVTNMNVQKTLPAEIEGM